MGSIRTYRVSLRCIGTNGTLAYPVYLIPTPRGHHAATMGAMARATSEGLTCDTVLRIDE